MHVLWQDLKVRLGAMHAGRALHSVHQPAHSSCILDDMVLATAGKWAAETVRACSFMTG